MNCCSNCNCRERGEQVASNAYYNDSEKKNRVTYGNTNVVDLIHKAKMEEKKEKKKNIAIAAAAISALVATGFIISI